MGLRWLIKLRLQIQAENSCRMVARATSAPFRFREIKAGEVPELRNSRRAAATTWLPSHPGHTGGSLRLCGDTSLGTPLPGGSSDAPVSTASSSEPCCALLLPVRRGDVELPP